MFYGLRKKNSEKTMRRPPPPPPPLPLPPPLLNYRGLKELWAGLSYYI